jgi:hypothetical protein
MATEYPPLGKSYVVSYANNDRDFPIIGIRKDPRMDNYKIPEDLSPHPDSVRYPNHVFTGANPTNSDERVLWTYEILPAPWVPFTRYDDDLGPVQGRRRSVKNEGQQASLTSSTKTTYEGREGSAIVLNEIEETWSIKTDDDGNSLFPIKVRDFYDEIRGPVQETRQIVVPDGTEEGSISNINGIITKISYDVYNQYLAFKVVETWRENGEDLIGGQTGQWGIESTERTLVPSGTPTEYGFGIKNSQLTPTNKEQSEKRQENYPVDSDNDGVIYTLSGQEQDEITKAVIKVEKSLVEAETVFSGRVADYITNLRNDGNIVEVQSIDKWHSITIASKIISPPNDQSWIEAGSINLPNRLLEVGVIWNSNFTPAGGTSGVGSITTIIENNINWTLRAESSITGEVVGSLYTKTRNGYSGAAQVEVVRTFHETAPTDEITIHKFEPVYGTVSIRSQSATNSSASSSNGVGDIYISSGGSQRFNNDYGLSISQFGPVEHDDITLTETGDAKTITESISSSSGSSPAGPYPVATASINIAGVANLELPASSTPLESGDTYVFNVDVKPWRLGWWVREIYTVTVP